MATAPEGGGAFVAGFAALPPQVCALALGTNGLGGCLAHWARIQGMDIAPLPLLFPLVAASLLAAYIAKVAIAPAAALRDLSDPASLSAFNGAPAVAQVLAVRFSAVLPLAARHCTIIVCYGIGLCVAVRFAQLCFRKGARPDPSWFPGLFLWGMTNVTVQAAGPVWLQALVPMQWWLLMALYAPLKAVVAYRMLLSPVRDAVAPNAGMNTLMAPGSFFTIMHLSCGKPGGDFVGLMLFADSTVFCFITCRLLYLRRSLWAGSFHPSYVAFTFPVASTATAAVLAAERLPAVAGRWSWAWATMLTVVAMCVICSVLLRFLWWLLGVVALAARVEGSSPTKTGQGPPVGSGKKTE